MYEVGPTSITIDHVNNFSKKKKLKNITSLIIFQKKKKVLVGNHKDCLPYPISDYNNIRAMIKTLFFFFTTCGKL